MAALTETSGLKSFENVGNPGTNPVDDDDDEDLEALRFAALMSMKAKAKSKASPVKSTQEETVDNARGFKRQGRFQRSRRGPTSGKFMWNHPSRSNLIVIQPVSLEEEKKPSAKQNSGAPRSEPSATTVKLELPQHRWCPISDESSSPKVPFTKRRVSGKFSHFESSSESDSDDDDDPFVSDTSNQVASDSDKEVDQDPDCLQLMASDSDTKDDLILGNTDSEEPSNTSKHSSSVSETASTGVQSSRTNTFNVKHSTNISQTCDSSLDGCSTTALQNQTSEHSDTPTSCTIAETSEDSNGGNCTTERTDRLEARRRKFESNIPVHSSNGKIVLKSLKNDRCDASSPSSVRDESPSVSDMDKSKAQEKSSDKNHKNSPVVRSVLSVVKPVTLCLSSDQSSDEEMSYRREKIVVKRDVSGKNSRRSVSTVVCRNNIEKAGDKETEEENRRLPVHMRLGFTVRSSGDDEKASRKRSSASGKSYSDRKRSKVQEGKGDFGHPRKRSEKTFVRSENRSRRLH